MHFSLFGYLVLVIVQACSLRYQLRLDAVLVLVSIAFIAILAIGAWIGWTMATTPPPKPIEEITTEIEEKKEEPEHQSKLTKQPATETSSQEKEVNKKSFIF